MPFNYCLILRAVHVIISVAHGRNAHTLVIAGRVLRYGKVLYHDTADVKYLQKNAVHVNSCLFVEKGAELAQWKSHATLTLLGTQDCPLWLQYD
mgnify:CR=1 FL=1